MAEQKINTVLYGAFFPTQKYGVQDMNTVLEGIVTDGTLVPFVTNVVVNFDVRVTLGLAKALGIKSRKTSAETIDFTVDTPDVSLDRIDSIFYRVDLSVAKRDSMVYRPGVAAASPVAPDPDISNPTLIKEIRICNIEVEASAPNILQGDIDETVQELSTVELLVDFAIEALNAINDEDGNQIKTFYSKRQDQNIYTYDKLSDLELNNVDFGFGFVIAMQKIVDQLIVLNPNGAATYLSQPNFNTYGNLVDDINANLGLTETEYSLQVETVRSEFSGVASDGLSNKVTIVAASTGDIYTGIFDISLTPDISMSKITKDRLLWTGSINATTYPDTASARINITGGDPDDFTHLIVEMNDQTFEIKVPAISGSEIFEYVDSVNLTPGFESLVRRGAIFQRISNLGFDLWTGYSAIQGSSTISSSTASQITRIWGTVKAQ